MTINEVRSCRPGDQIVFKSGKHKDTCATITRIYICGMDGKYRIAYEQNGVAGVTTYKKVGLKYSET